MRCLELTPAKNKPHSAAMLSSRIPNITRPVYPGEAVTLDANSVRFSARRWSVYLRTDPTAYSVRLGGWNPDTSGYEVNAGLDAALSAIALLIVGDVSPGPHFQISPWRISAKRLTAGAIPK